MIHFTLDPVVVPVYACLWQGYKALWRWLWWDICESWKEAFPKHPT